MSGAMPNSHIRTQVPGKRESSIRNRYRPGRENTTNKIDRPTIIMMLFLVRPIPLLGASSTYQVSQKNRVIILIDTQSKPSATYSLSPQPRSWCSCLSFPLFLFSRVFFCCKSIHQKLCCYICFNLATLKRSLHDI